MKKRNKFYAVLSILLIVTIVLIFTVIYYINNKSNNYSFSEKSWMNSNQNNVIDISVEGSLPTFSDSGEGLFYDLLNDLEKDTNLTFNVSVNGSASYRLSNKNSVSDNDTLIYRDHFVIISSIDKEISSISDISTQPIGVLTADKEYISNYLLNYNLDLKEYKTFDEMKSSMNNNITYAIVPLHKSISNILYNKYNIVYHIEGLHSNYVLTINNGNETLNNIIYKFLNKENDKIYTDISKHLLKLYYKVNNVSEIEREKISRDDLLVGYIENMPYEGKINGTLSGISSEYLKLFANMTGATYKYIKYNNLNDLSNALNNNKIDIAFNYYNLSNSNYKATRKLGSIKYVVVTNNDNSLVIDNLNSIKDKTVKTIANTNIYNYLKNLNIQVVLYNNYKELIKSLEEDDILVIEKSTYDYYKDSSLKDYTVKYMSTSNASNDVLLNSSNQLLNNLFGFYTTTLGINEIENKAISDSLNSVKTNKLLEFILENLTYIIVLTGALIYLVYKMNKKVKVTKKIKKEDKMMYLDVMTNLKNRNYLNDNLVYWEANKIYPQSIVVVDLNNISEINDTKGHEEGDNQIIGAARILINTQRENTEIIRSNGNEFLIYMVGYDEKQVVTYVNKLVKEFKNLPYEYGASVGYSMILSESTTLDDAINEAVNMMRKNKGE